MQRMIIIFVVAFLSLGHGAYAGQVETDLINLLNEVRAKKGRKALLASPALMAAAEAHAQDMVAKGYFSHKGKDGSRLGTRVKQQGYKFCYAAENIAWGQKSAAEAMVSWQKSSGHRKNNLSRKPTEVGAGFAGGEMWVMVFAKPC